MSLTAELPRQLGGLATPDRSQCGDTQASPELCAMLVRSLRDRAATTILDRSASVICNPCYQLAGTCVPSEGQMNQMAAGQKTHLRTYPTLILTRSDVYCRRHASSRPWLSRSSRVGCLR